ALVFAALAIARKYFKTPAQDMKEAENADSSLPSVILANAVMIAVGLVLAFGLHTILVYVNRYFAMRDGAALMVLYPSAAIWWFLPGFAAVCLAWEITFKAWCLLNRRQAEAYRAFSNVKSGFDSTKVLRIMAIVIVLPIGVATVLALPMHCSLTDQAIQVGHYAKLHEAVLPYRDATELIQFDGYTLRDGSFERRAGLLVRFRQGQVWNSADCDDPKETVDSALIQIVVSATGLPIQHVEIEPK
ncbi:MAG: hypothetical protein WB439_02465, partial [Acidobacteriaceae bacterium]